ncbi:MAG: GNAT family N-acetyltransferase [Candidatus Cloacimonetes bacterium]|jgi:GNAT superfamily N-acetyltransferase|nr:GNAT family N-acetyltransferase [Candidatus Cloacimonadota bacterium]MCB5287788.1 GNAT family N-acetyltransferase [Candidatus Cloacimonadota bacterium]MCK9183789.1 GNAT family N-acetyltransferase [Candidatus Cloacimonadota bacterium]MCK9584345.1 GNAT family N-acetyltransferase [Candidatus Cloacimonadota bacterium]MDY0230109.1 GNAT family N-acetyltransferase [Candidatus Cloacimonadaceae bacterium]
MAIPFNMNRLKETELLYPQRFASMQQKDYGLIFFNEGNKSSQESNHAVIKEYIGIESSIRNIESFYKAKGIKPCFFSALHSEELVRLIPTLENHEYQIHTVQEDYLLHDHEGSLRAVSDLIIQRIRRLDIEIMETIALEYGTDSTIKVVQRHLQHPSYHLLAGFHDGELAALASVSTYAGYSRVSDIFTRDKYRGKGYGGAMIQHLIDYHRGISANYLYLFSDDPGTTKIVEKGGFSKLPLDFQGWVATKEA